MESEKLVEALRRVGNTLAEREPAGSIRVCIAGGSAGLLSGTLRVDRVTGDCDVMATEPGNRWSLVAEASASVARRLGLPERWMNQDCAMFAHCIAPGWRDRCVVYGTFGALEVCVLSRGDQIASKIISAPKMPQDVQDLLTMDPSMKELDFAESNIDRLEAESLDGKTLEDARAVLRSLRGRA